MTISGQMGAKKVNDKNSSSPLAYGELWKCPRRVQGLTFRFYYFVSFSSLFFSAEKRKKEILVSKSFPQKEKTLNPTCILLLLFIVVLRRKIEVVNHRNHYFMEKCNYELVEKRRGRQKASRRCSQENLILTT